MSDQVLVVTFSGRVDLTSAAGLKACLRRFGARRVVLNLGRAEFLGWAPLALTIRIARSFAHDHGEVVLSQRGHVVRQLMTHLGIVLWFKAFRNDEEALAFFADEAGAPSLPIRRVRIGSSALAGLGT